ncbi:hypothetical protein BTJ49_14560 [Oleiagrimonas sp. MCCC 1A03011]|nr:hypothetical protein BTJ49_14560 [Oleiagrimonas sp. MCCC 1A03011]
MSGHASDLVAHVLSGLPRRHTVVDLPLEFATYALADQTMGQDMIALVTATAATLEQARLTPSASTTTASVHRTSSMDAQDS